MNHTFVALVLKNEKVNRVEQFRPIAFCNVSNKTITKILANRLRTVLESIILPNQFAFILGRLINDNSIISHEIMHYMIRKRGEIGSMAIKIDLAKAYDCVDWNFLKNVMLANGFQPHFCDLIFECVSSASFSFLINGLPYRFLKPSRGIRGGDSMSLALFTLVFVVLSRLLAQAEQEGKYMVQKSQESVRLSLT